MYAHLQINFFSLLSPLVRNAYELLIVNVKEIAFDDFIVKKFVVINIFCIFAMLVPAEPLCNA